MNNYVSIKLILDRILRHPLMQDLSLETAIDYTVDFIRIVGMPKMFMEKEGKVEIDNYRGLLPDDVHQIISVHHNGNKLNYTATSEIIKNKDLPQEDSTLSNNPSGDNNVIQDHLTAAQITRGDFIFTQDLQTYVKTRGYNSDTYKIQNNIIYTSIKKGTLDIIYSALQTDEEGFPMVLDNSSYLRALELYIKKQWFTILFDMGKIQGAILQNVRQEYAWAVGDCQSEFNRMSLDQAELFYRSLRSAVLSDEHPQYGFKYLGG